MKYSEYLNEACRYIDEYRDAPTTMNLKALPTQLQSTNIALLMAICDLIKALQDEK